ncbi:uncharacterized protein THITE_47478 [Thermothielavioides terrestris NRRL 8126]|uniref:Ig-like domain-containing protein n=1 Tax=Thermothielavioides terrestris (strain ATCC 38088 / NRRL 8126) TaxID=578455 RepID=G2QVE9_THETT|nr:uncharacterized protein THITE_47478 [Thermothielavioides terrestris NRRL 8126]AEO64639.1 hypothetical protein THITE_47478 [Thermothielavioides terrestris NRRL 8126]
MACRLRLSILPAAWLVLSVNVLAAGQNATADAVVGWVAGPSERGTLNLVWSCVITIFACTWTVLHLNVPGLHEGPWRRGLRKAKWMAINVLFPEFILSKAVCDLRQALYDLCEFDEKMSVSPRILWTMESDRTATETGTRVVLANRPADDWQTTQRWTLAHSYYAQMGGLIYVGPSSDRGEPAYYVARPSSLIWRFMWTPDHHPLYYLVLSEQDIQDRSKADWLVKSIALMQITWLVLNVAVRRSTGLPVTQLEIATLSFAVMAIITYLANWWKPKDVSQPTILPAVYETLAFSIHEGAFDRTQPFTRRLWSPAQAAMDAASIPDLERVPNDVVWMEGATPLMLVLMAISSLVFGGLHCLAWSFEFPTPAERICWRVASLVSAILPVATLGASAVLNHLSTTSAESRILSTFLTKLRPLKQLPLECGILYTAARLAILVLVFTSLRRVPAGVYQDTPWTRFLPTFS